MTKAEILNAKGIESFEILVNSSSEEGSNISGSDNSTSSVNFSEPEEIPAYDEGFDYITFPNLSVKQKIDMIPLKMLEGIELHEPA
jgi:hypothetical protein